LPLVERMRFHRVMRVISLVLCLGFLTGCAHRQPTNRQVAIGIGAVVGLTLLLLLAKHQCDKGASYCDNEP
jgi:hypothetical protein